MAEVKHTGASGGMEVTRRRLLLAAPIVGAAIAAPAVAKAVLPEEPTTHAGMPFLKALSDDPETIALCIPASRIAHAYLYMLRDGRTIYGEWNRCDDGFGWRSCKANEWDGLIVGRVITLLRLGEKGWFEASRSELAG